VPAGVLAFLQVLAADAGRIHGVLGGFPVMDRVYFVQGRYELPEVAGLDSMVPRDPVRDILHVPAFHHLAGHLLKAEGDRRDPQPVGRISAKRHRAGGPDNGEGAVRKDAVDHAGDTLLLRMHPDIVLLRGLPRPLVAGCNAEVKKIAEGHIDLWADNLRLGPDHLHVKLVAEVVGELLADRIPVGFLDRVVPFIIIPDRAGMDPDKVRDGEMLCSGRHGY